MCLPDRAVWFVAALLSLAAQVERLGADRFVAREAAQAALAAKWPLSRPLLLGGMRSPDPEIRHRAATADVQGANRVAGKHGRTLRGLMARPGASEWVGWLMTVQADLVRWDMVDYALADPTGKRVLALWLILAPFPDPDGNPWAPSAVHKAYCADAELARALCDLVNETWRYPDGERIWLACDPELKGVQGMKGYLGGLDNVRFWARGLPDPQDYRAHDVTRKQWARAKDAGVTETTELTPPKGK